MTHDPLCEAPLNETLADSWLTWSYSCQCDLIARVRADERHQAKAQRILGKA